MGELKSSLMEFMDLRRLELEGEVDDLAWHRLCGKTGWVVSRETIDAYIREEAANESNTD